MSDSGVQHNATGEWVKFLLLLMVLGATLIIMALLQPLIFGRIVPAVLGDGQGVIATDPLPTASPSPLPLVEPTATLQPTPATTAEPPTQTPQPFVSYTVQPGDNLIEIADRFGVTVEAISSANNITTPNQIVAGTILIIPTEGQ
jgi:hypothetical protein